MIGPIKEHQIEKVAAFLDKIGRGEPLAESDPFMARSHARILRSIAEASKQERENA